ncbi:MAG: hypothetical protein ACEY3D_09785, partial [Rickettsia sp.]|uniref:hypothetical protein n=1 Tax=Rickettsia sp. TaxID=789 RepID=UPI00397B80B2
TKRSVFRINLIVAKYCFSSKSLGSKEVYSFLPPYQEDTLLILYQFLSVPLYHFTSVANT